MNRIYQGRVSGVEIPIKVTLPTKEGRKAKSEIRWLPFHTNQQEAQRLLDEVKPRLSELGNVIGDLITKLQKAKGRAEQWTRRADCQRHYQSENRTSRTSEEIRRALADRTLGTPPVISRHGELLHRGSGGDGRR